MNEEQVNWLHKVLEILEKMSDERCQRAREIHQELKELEQQRRHCRRDKDMEGAEQCAKDMRALVHELEDLDMLPGNPPYPEKT